MSSDYLNHALDPAHQREQADPKQVLNNAGGYTFAVDDWERLKRFLILGSEGGTYYVGERELTRENAKVVEKLIAKDGARVVAEIVKISDAGRAPKNDPAILALAMCARLGDEVTKLAAWTALPKVCRTGTHLYHFVAFADKLGGWGRSMRRAVAKWFTDKPADELAHQLIKYQQRDGWAARDLLRLSHAKPPTGEHDVLFAWATGGRDAAQEKLTEKAGKKDRFVLNPLPPMLEAFEELKGDPGMEISRAVELIRQYKLPREALPTQMLNKREVWDALLPHMGATAMMRNLATMTRVGLLEPLGERTAYVASKLANAEFLKKGRVHPIQALAALKVYAQGHGERGSNTWRPVQPIVDALDAAFYSTFDNVEPTGKSTVLALDVSGSMTWESSKIAGMPGITARIASVAMALVTLHVEPRAHVVGFTQGQFRSMHHGIGSGLVDVPISARMRLDDAIRVVEAIPAGGTDCALPILWAKTQRSAVESFAIYTDNETWAGNVHPHIALRDYRQAKGVASRLAVVGMASTGFTIADPDDAGMMDFVGFDSAAPAVMADFFRGTLESPDA